MAANIFLNALLMVINDLFISKKELQMSQTTIPLLAAVRCMDADFSHTLSKETCAFCDKGKIISGVWINILSTGHCCCEKCYHKADGFNKWFVEAENILPSIPKQFDWFMQMYFKGYTPKEAVEDMMLIV